MIHARFLMSLKRRRGRPSAWLSAPRGAAAVRPCGPDGPTLITNVAGSLVYCWPQTPARTSVRLAFRGTIRDARSRLRRCAPGLI